MSPAAHRERDIRPARHAARAVVLAPALVDRDLGLVVARGQVLVAKVVGAVAVRVLQPGAEAVGLPVTGTPQLALEAAGHGRDHRVRIARDPVRLVRVIELHRLRCDGRFRGMFAPPGVAFSAVVLAPAAVQRRLVLPAAGRHGERALPNVVGRVEGEVSVRTVRLPVARAAELALEAAGDRHARGRWGVGGQRRRPDEKGRQGQPDKRRGSGQHAAGHGSPHRGYGLAVGGFSIANDSNGSDTVDGCTSAPRCRLPARRPAAAG